ncbi:unnamed protein product [Rhizophagus irregularis]|uniref:Uncharacterized protein n=2 Tax=Rhizophagus irregularis TaxID=588596 RepID=A0A915Z4E9_9GLOM|nr:unnamed protein product [Rhizophagus irregularis]CAB5189080.1 unnamed protein product [Rhizophagus irregularis]CAB5362204.1 unnamed protein product [Rhizophagus irregularis]
MKYSLIAIFYILLQLVSIILLIILIYSLLKSEPHFMKWTIFQLFVAAIGNGFSALPPIIIYGDELMERAFETPICLISNKITSFTFYPMQFFPLFIAFYLWYALNKGKADIEQKCFLWVSTFVWAFSLIFNIIDTIMSMNEKNWGVVVTVLHCKRSQRSSFYAYTIPTSILALVAFIMACHSSFILYKQWKYHNARKNIATAVVLGRAVRLNTFCFIYIIFLTLTLIPRIISYPSDDSKSNSAFLISSFMGILPGTLLFLVFGAKKQAALFLPFCYYVPPGKPFRSPPECDGSIHMEEDGSSTSDDHESIQLEIRNEDDSYPTCRACQIELMLRNNVSPSPPNFNN